MRFLLSSILVILAVPAGANVVGSDAQNFNPTTSGLDFITVQSSETLEPGVLNLGLFANYAKNALPYYEAIGGGRAKRDSSLVGGDFNLGLGLTRQWDAGVSFPFILQQSISDETAVGRYSATGNTEVRINTKLRLLGNQRRGLAIIASSNYNRIANNPYVGEGGGPIYNVELAADTTIGQMALALNLGHRWRNAGESITASGIDPIPDQWLASSAVSYLFDNIDTKVVFELLAAIPKGDQLEAATDREYTVMEGLVGVKYDSSSNLSFHLGGGAGLSKGISSPDYRVYTGLNISFATFGTKRSSKSDPYSVRQPRKAPRPKVARASIKPPPEPVKTETAKTPKASPPRDFAPTEEDLLAADEVNPATSTETIREVQVFNRGGFNHIVLQHIEFVPNTKSLKPESERYLTDDLLPALRELNRRRPIGTIVVEGHTDSIGEESYNRELSEVRAEVVGTLLRQQLGLNIPIRTIGVGESSPIADNGNFQGRALNRRVEIKVLYRRSTR